MLARAGLMLTTGTLLLALCAGMGFWSGRENGRLEAALPGLRGAASLARFNLAAADSASTLARQHLAAAEVSGLTAFLSRFESRSGEAPAETLAVKTRSFGHWAVQVSSHRQAKDAREEAETLELNSGRQATVEKVQVGPQPWYRVLIEGFPSQAAAQHLADSLLAAGVIHEYVLQNLSRPTRTVQP